MPVKIHETLEWLVDVSAIDDIAGIAVFERLNERVSYVVVVEECV